VTASFDRVNHDILMARLARRVGDKRLLKIIRRFLEAGMMQAGVCIERHEGTPQGGPLSPLLANLLLDDLDKELERRGHRFCRYADDCNIYVQSQAAGERVMASVVAFLESKLRLRVNRAKSAAAPVMETFVPRLSSPARRAARSCTEKPRSGQGAASTDHPA
jgi:RNA-directed DNA polymerase